MYTLWEDLDERFSWLGRFIFTKFKEVEGAAVGSSDGKFGADEFELCTGEMGWDGKDVAYGGTVCSKGPFIIFPIRGDKTSSSWDTSQSRSEI